MKEDKKVTDHKDLNVVKDLKDKTASKDVVMITDVTITDAMTDVMDVEMTDVITVVMIEEKTDVLKEKIRMTIKM